MADAAGVQAHEHLARPRPGELHVLDDERLPELLEHRGADLHGRDAIRSAPSAGSRISLTSTCGGWDTAYMTARAMSSASSAPDVGRLSKNGVSTMPGSIEVTRMPVSSRSWRSASAIAVTACLVTE